MQNLVSSQTRAITQADHWVRAGSMASTLSVPGITGNFIDAAARANPGSRRTVFRPTRSKSKTVEIAVRVCIARGSSGREPGDDQISSYRSAIAKAASTVGIDHAQSRRTEMAAAATTQPTRKPISRRSELFSRSRSTGINGRRGDVSSISDNTALVRLPVITAVETAFGKAKRSRAY